MLEKASLTKALIAGSKRQSFTLLESLLAITVAAMAGSAVLAGVYAALQSADLSLRQVVALGLAEQLVDEVYGCRYSETDAAAYTLNLGPEYPEGLSGTRLAFDDVDDYHGVVCQPPTDRWGVPVGRDDGTGGTRWPPLAVNWPPLEAIRLECSVGYVRKDDLRQPVSIGAVSDFRAVEVRASFRLPNGTTVPLGRLRRVVAFLPPLQ